MRIVYMGTPDFAAVSLKKLIDEKFDESIGKGAEVPPKNISNTKQFEVKTPDVVIKVNPERPDLIKTEVIDGTKYIMIRAENDVTVNGVNITIAE